MPHTLSDTVVVRLGETDLAAKAADIVQDLVSAGHSLAAIVAAFVHAVPPAALKEAGVVVQSPQARLAAQRAQQASDYWLLCPQEIRGIIVDFAGPLTRFLHGGLDVDTMDKAAKRALWVDAFQPDWQGDLGLLPAVKLELEDVVHVKSIGMYQRLCKRFDGEWVRCIPMQKMWLDATPTVPMVVLGIMAVQGNCVDFLKHLIDEELVTIEELEQHHACAIFMGDKSVLSLAAYWGRLEMVQYLLSRPDVRCTPRAMDFAAVSGNLDLVIWFHTNRTEGCTVNAMNWAAQCGRLHIVQWLHANRTEGCTTDAIDKAAENGHLDVVQWLHANRTEGFTADAIINAKTDEIAAVLVKSLSGARRDAIVDAIITSGNKAAILRLMALAK